MKQDHLYQLVFEAIIIGFITIKKVFFFFFFKSFPWKCDGTVCSARYFHFRLLGYFNSLSAAGLLLAFK